MASIHRLRRHSAIDKHFGKLSVNSVRRPDIAASTAPVLTGIPSALQGSTTVKDTAVGPDHACAIDAGSISCWGSNTYGQAPATVTLQTDDVPLRVVAGKKHSCALVQNGTVKKVRCWGDSTVASTTGSTSKITVPATVGMPVRIAAGDDHTCVVNGNFTPGNNSVICWGDNSLYQTTIPLALSNPVDIKAQGNRTCAVQAGQSRIENALKCWPISNNPTLGGSTDNDGDGITDYYEIYEKPVATNPQSVVIPPKNHWAQK